MPCPKTPKRDPCKAPWPPGVDHRMVTVDKLGLMIQLREGSFSCAQVFAEALPLALKMCTN